MSHQFLHRGMVWCGGLGKGLHVRVDKTGNLQVCFFQEALSKSSHKTHGQFGLEEHNGSNHTELWVEMLVHEELNHCLLNLNHKRQCLEYIILQEKDL